MKVITLDRLTNYHNKIKETYARLDGATFTGDVSVGSATNNKNLTVNGKNVICDYGSSPTNGKGAEITQPSGDASMSIRTTNSASKDAGIIYLSQDSSYVANSGDSGYVFGVFNTDVTLDMSNSSNAEFSVLEDGKGCLIKGNTVVHSGNISSYKAGSAGSADSATSADKVWTQSHNGSWYINSNWDNTYFQTNAKSTDGSTLPINVSHADSAGSAAPSFADSTWYAVGNDCYIGDHDVGGNLCIKGANASPGITFYNSDGTYNSIAITSANISSYASKATVSNNAPTLSWGTTSTVGSIDGTGLTVTMPSNPVPSTNVTGSYNTSTGVLTLSIG